MKEKKLKRFLLSIRGHIDSGHLEVVQEKKNVDTSLEKILKLTDADDQKDTNSFGDSNEVSELRPLVQELYKQYQSLYGHYDHLIGKLKKKVHHDGESNGSFLANFSSSDSDSSDSESSEFYNDNEKKTNRAEEGEVEENKILIEECEYLKAELERLKIRNAEMETEALSMVSKIKEGEFLATRLAEREAACLAMEVELNRMGERNEWLQVAHENLKRECNEQQVLTSQRLQLFVEEKEALLREKSTALDRLEQADKYVEECKEKIEQFKDDISKLQAENASMKKEIENLEVELSSMKESSKNLQVEKENLKQELENSNHQVADLIQRLTTFEEDTVTLKSDILQITTKMLEAEKIIEELRSDCELLKDEKSKLLGINEDLNQQLRIKDDEKVSLSLEHNEVVIKLKQIQENMEMLSKELERSNAENTQLTVKYEGLQLEFEGASCEVSDMRRMLLVSQEEKSAITAENSVLLGKTEESERMMDELKAEKQRLECDHSALKHKIDDLVRNLESAEEEKKTLASEKLEMLSKLEQVESSLNETLNEVEQLRRENCVFQQDQLVLQHEISELGRRLEDKEGEISRLQESLDEASSQIQTMTTNAGNVQQELDLACIKINELEEQVKTTTDTASEKQVLMEKLENELRSEVITRETMMKEQKDNLDQLLTKYMLLENQLQESSTILGIAEGKLAEMESKDETIQLLRTVDQEQKRQISRLEGNLIELSEKLKLFESERVDLGKEITKLYGQVQTLEVQIRLANQKLKITETENKEKEESYRRRMVTLQEEHQRLEEHKSTLSWKLNLMGDDFKQIKELVKVEMESLFRSLNVLDTKFGEHCAHIQNRVSGCTDDVTRIKDGVKALIYTREGFKNEKRELSMRLNYKEGIISMLKDEAGVLGSKLATKAKEEERLVLKATELEKRMQELERKVKENEEELFSKDEEKREAIRQLCSVIEYHRENCNHLCKFLSVTLKRGRRTA